MSTPDDQRDTLPSGEGGASANPGYALHQVARALATERDHPDGETRERARHRVSDWLRVAGGMLAGTLHIGSRTPIAGAPAWATTRVVQGGFATGELAAGGPLLPHEVDLLHRLPGTDVPSGRAALNAYYLTEAGLAELLGMLDSGRYRVDVPEEGALLTVAWLAAHGHEATARGVLDEIAPHFGTLRFYPVPAAEPLAGDGLVRLQDASDLVRALRAAQTPPDILQQTEALTVWHPHQDRVVALLAETVAGDMPTLVSQEPDGRSVVAGGWPFAVYPDGWAGRAHALLAEYDQLRVAHPLSTKPHDPSDNPTRLRRVLAVAAGDPTRLTGREVGLVRTALAQIAAKRGLPGSDRLGSLRTEQTRVAALPTKAVWAAELADRLAQTPPAGGLTPSEVETLLDVLPPQAHRYDFRPALLRTVDATPEQHVAWGTVTSGETLARVVPGIAARARSAGIDDPALRRLDEAVYTAFRRRRSVLLLNLESQVKLSELPWVRAVEPLRGTDAQTQAAARDALAHVVTLALASFPWQILPNKLLQEVRALAEAAGRDVPIVDEVAADIFMGTFTEKYLRAAQMAGRMLEGSFYARYYGIDYAAVRGIADVLRPERGAPTSPAFDRLCHARAGQSVSPTPRWGSVAENGAVIEQEQVLTTHNLAVLFDALSLRTKLADRLGTMAQRAFGWACDTLEHLPVPPGRLRAFKNAAYAWRQLVFFLSQMPPADVADFVEWARDDLSDRPEPFQTAFGPVLSGLTTAARGMSSGEEEVTTVVPFYGWVTGSNALLGALVTEGPASRTV